MSLAHELANVMSMLLSVPNVPQHRIKKTVNKKKPAPKAKYKPGPQSYRMAKR